MAERRVSVKFSAEIQGFKAAMAEAAAATQKVKKASEDSSKAADTNLGRMVQSASKNRDAWEQSGGAIAGFGAAALAGVGLAVKSFAEFDKQMSSVQAATHATGGEMSQLRDLAVTAGADTSFSAKEAAQGIEELSKAGVKTKDILGGGLAGALSLAAAGELGVGEAAETAASAMTQFGKSGEDIPHIADLLAAAAGKAQGSVSDMGAALNQTGLVAAATGLSIEETTGGLAAFASAGLTGSDAGTSFKSMLQHLTPQSAEAKAKMDELGVSAYDAQGNFVGLSKFSENLKTSMQDLTPEARNAAMGVIFGSDAVRAANVLYEQGAAGIDKWTDAVNASGYAAETARLKQDNLAGDIEKLGGSIDSVFLKSASGANEALRGLVQGAEDLVDAIGKIPGPILNVALGIGGITGAAALAGGAFLTLFPKVMETHAAFKTLAADSPKAAGALGKVGKAAGIAAAALVGLQIIGAISKAMGPAAKSTEEYGQAFLTLQNSTKDLDSITRNIGGLGTQINGVGDALARRADFDWFDNLNNAIGDMVGGTSKTQEVRDSIVAIDDTLAGLASNGGAQKAADSFKILAAEADKSAKAQGRQGVSTKDALDLMPGYKDALLAQATAAGVNLSEQELLDFAMGKIPASMENAAGAAEKYTDASGKSVPVSEDMAKALEEVGLSADGAVTNLEKYVTALFNAGLLEMDARSATAAHQAAIDATSAAVVNAKKAIEDKLVADGMGVDAAKALAEEQYNLGGALNKSKTDFDLTSEAGRVLNDQFQSIASTGMAEIEAKAKDGAGQPELQKNLSATYESLKTAGVGMGLTAGAADDLARRVLGVPDKADINTWMSSEAKRMAEQTKGAIDAIPKNVTVNTTFNETTIQRVIRQLSGDAAPVGAGTVLAPKKATGGRLTGYADGGQLPTTGPGTGMTDGFLGINSLGIPTARVDAGEWIINGRSSDRYNRELAAINAGTFPKLPGYANGGREYTAQSLGHGSYRATPVSSVTYQIDAKPGLAYEYAKDIAHQTATRTRDINAAYGI
jgi:TP901 family phage tail tape measure protein